MTCFSPLSVLELHFPKPCPANSVNLYKSRSRQIFLTPRSPFPNLLCSGRMGIFEQCCLLQVLKGQRCHTGLLHVVIVPRSLCSATFRGQTAAQVSLSHEFWVWQGWNSPWAGHRGFPSSRESLSYSSSIRSTQGGSLSHWTLPVHYLRAHPWAAPPCPILQEIPSCYCFSFTSFIFLFTEKQYWKTKNK